MGVRGVLLIALGAAAGCGAKQQVAALETQYDRAVADRDRAMAERDQARDRLLEREAADRARLDAFAPIHARLAALGEQGLAEVRFEDGRVWLGLPADALFVEGSADLTDPGRETVRRLGQELRGAGARFQVRAVPGAAPPRGREFPTPWHLGADRAITVVLALIEAGMPAADLVASTAGPGDAAGEGRVELVWSPDPAAALPYGRMAEELGAP